MVFAGPSHGKALPHACACARDLSQSQPRPLAFLKAKPGLQGRTGRGGDFGRAETEIGSAAELPKCLRRLRGGAGWQSPPCLRQKLRLWSEREKKILTPFLSPFSPLCPSRMSPPPFKPRFSMTSFDEILQHRNLRPSSAQDFFFSCRVFWQDPVPAIQIGPSDNKLRALPLRHNRFPQRSSKYLRVFISPLRDG